MTTTAEIPILEEHSRNNAELDRVDIRSAGFASSSHIPNCDRSTRLIHYFANRFVPTLAPNTHFRCPKALDCLHLNQHSPLYNKRGNFDPQGEPGTMTVVTHARQSRESHLQASRRLLVRKYAHRLIRPAHTA